MRKAIAALDAEQKAQLLYVADLGTGPVLRGARGQHPQDSCGPFSRRRLSRCIRCRTRRCRYSSACVCPSGPRSNTHNRWI